MRFLNMADHDNYSKEILTEIPSSELLPCEWLAVPRIDQFDSQGYESFQAGMRGFRIVDQGVEHRAFHILEKIPTE